MLLQVDSFIKPLGLGFTSEFGPPIYDLSNLLC